MKTSPCLSTAMPSGTLSCALVAGPPSPAKPTMPPPPASVVMTPSGSICARSCRPGPRSRCRRRRRTGCPGVGATSTGAAEARAHRGTAVAELLAAARHRRHFPSVTTGRPAAFDAGRCTLTPFDGSDPDVRFPAPPQATTAHDTAMTSRLLASNHAVPGARVDQFSMTVSLLPGQSRGPWHRPAPATRTRQPQNGQSAVVRGSSAVQRRHDDTTPANPTTSTRHSAATSTRLGTAATVGGPRRRATGRSAPQSPPTAVPSVSRRRPPSIVLSGLEGTYAVPLTGPAIYSTSETRPNRPPRCCFHLRAQLPWAASGSGEFHALGHWAVISRIHDARLLRARASERR